MDVLKYSDIKGMDVKAIDKKVTEIRVQLFNKKIQSSTSGIEKPHEFKIMKKNIARLLTSKSQQQKVK